MRGQKSRWVGTERQSVLSGSVFTLSDANMEKDVQPSPEFPEHLLAMSEIVVRYAKGCISHQEYSEKLNAWWDINKEVWQESDLGLLLRLTCLFK